MNLLSKTLLTIIITLSINTATADKYLYQLTVCGDYIHSDNIYDLVKATKKSCFITFGKSYGTGFNILDGRYFIYYIHKDKNKPKYDFFLVKNEKIKKAYSLCKSKCLKNSKNISVYSPNKCECYGS